MKPYAIDHVENDEGTVIKSFKPSEYGSLMSEEESAILRQLMTDVVQEGTASKLKGLEYTAAGKTGSAEYNNIKGDSHAWFTGFAPAEDPEVCVITSIGLDHMEYLGDTVEQIAGEKAGIIRPGVPVFYAQSAEESDRVIEKTAAQQGSCLLYTSPSPRD